MPFPEPTDSSLPRGTDTLRPVALRRYCLPVNIRRRHAVFGLLVLLATSAVFGAWITRSPPSRSNQAASARARATATTLRPIVGAPGPPYAVGTISLDLSEPATPGHVPRSLHTQVRYPAAGKAGTIDRAAASPERTSGPYPLVVFSEGFGIAAEAYSSLLDAWAAAGYVVADPVYPLTASPSPGALNESDIVNHPGDLSFVVTSILAAGSAAGGTLSGLVNPSEVGVIGHSDGGDVSLATASNSCCKDNRITAAIILSGAESTSLGGTYFSTPPIPMLVAQGSADTINPTACSVQIYDHAPQPKYYLSLAGQSHESPYLQAGGPFEIVKQVTIDFLDGYLRHSTSKLGSIDADGNVSGLATLTTAPSVGPVIGSCPGGPAD